MKKKKKKSKQRRANKKKKILFKIKKKCQSNSEVHELQNWFTQGNIEESKSHNPIFFHWNRIKTFYIDNNASATHWQHWKKSHNQIFIYALLLKFTHSHIEKNVPVSYFTKQSMSKKRNIKIWYTPTLM